MIVHWRFCRLVWSQRIRWDSFKLWVSRTDRGCRRVRVSLHRLLKSSHFLDSKHLPSPLLIDCLSLLAFKFKLFCKPFLLLLQNIYFSLHFDYLFVCLFGLFTLEPIYCFEQPVWIFHFMLYKWPQLFEKSTKILRLLLSLLEFLIKKLFTVAQQTN